MARDSVDSVMGQADRLRKSGAISAKQHAKLKGKATAIKGAPAPKAAGMSTSGALKGAGVAPAAGVGNSIAGTAPPGPPATSTVRPASRVSPDTVVAEGAPSWGNESAPTRERKVMTGA